MNEMLSNLRADLLDRRMRLPLIAAVVLMLAGIAYAALGSSSPSAAESSGSGSAGSGAAPTFSTGQAKNPHAAVAETTYGQTYQHAGKLVDPFTTLSEPSSAKPSAKPATNTAKPGAAPNSSHSSSSGAKTPPNGSPGGSSTTPPKPVKPKAVTEYTVNVEFGKAPANVGETPHLVLFKKLKVGSAVPSKSDHLLTLSSATVDAKKLAENEKGAASVTFKLNAANPPILSGEGACLPSSSQCESLRLEVNQSERLQYLEANGESVTYMLRPIFVGSFTTLAKG